MSCSSSGGGRDEHGCRSATEHRPTTAAARPPGALPRRAVAPATTSAAPASVARSTPIRQPAGIAAWRCAAIARHPALIAAGTIVSRAGANPGRALATRPWGPRSLRALGTRTFLAAQAAASGGLAITLRRSVGHERLTGRRAIGIVPSARRRAVWLPSAAGRTIGLPASRRTIVTRTALVVATIDLIVDGTPRVSVALALPGGQALAGTIRQDAHGVVRHALDLAAVRPAGMVAPVLANLPRHPIPREVAIAEVRRAEVVVAHEDVAVEPQATEWRERRPADVAPIGAPSHPRRPPRRAGEPRPAPRRQIRPATVVECPAPRLVGPPRPAVGRPRPPAVEVRLPPRRHARTPEAAVPGIGLPRAIGAQRLFVLVRGGCRVGGVVVRVVLLGLWRDAAWTLWGSLRLSWGSLRLGLGIVRRRIVRVVLGSNRRPDRAQDEHEQSGRPPLHGDSNTGATPFVAETTRISRRITPGRRAPRPPACRRARSTGTPRRSATASRAPCPWCGRRCRWGRSSRGAPWRG